MATIDPRQFIITRKRKKYKFALFANSPLCFEIDEWHKRPADVVEIGAGTALFLVQLATRYPQKTFVAIDVKADRLQRGAREAEIQRLTNIVFLRARADQVEELFDQRSIDQLWLTFPDPYPKSRSAGRRLTHPTFLRHYQALLRAHGSLYLKHDNYQFFCWSLEQLVALHWCIVELSFDLHDSDYSEDYKLKTSYEQRWLDEGRSTHFVRAEIK